MDERPKSCHRCRYRFRGDDGWTSIHHKDAPVEFICWRCRQNEAIDDYLTTGTIDSQLMIAASLYSIRIGVPPGQLRAEVHALYEASGETFARVAAEVKEVGAKAREFEARHWLPTLKAYYAAAEGGGHAEVREDFKALMWGCAGRVLLTLQGTPQGRFKGAWVTLIFDETADEARGGIQGICASRDEAVGMLQATIDVCPVLRPDDEVSLAGL